MRLSGRAAARAERRDAERERLDALSSCEEPTAPDSPSTELLSAGVDERDGSISARLRFTPDAITLGRLTRHNCTLTYPDGGFAALRRYGNASGT